jgi:hypothetical protein
MDLMFKATTKEAWDAFKDTLPLSLCDIDEIGQIGENPEYHVNVRITGEADFELLAEGAEGVEWVDPDTVETPSRIWAGGMNYWKPDA